MTATPVCKLREQAKRLEAALSVGVSTPTVKAVHELRAATRRVEAQLELLSMMHGLPPYHPDADKVLRRLESLRKQAGKVRDCDVHLKLLDDKDSEMRSLPESTAALTKSKDKLQKRLSRKRSRKEDKLLATIKQQLPKLSRDTERLLKALKPAEDRAASVAEMLRLIDHKFDRHLTSRETGEEHLHELRKASKRARYQCEGLPGPQAAALARRLENLQDAGGSWHDLLDLTKRCHATIGPDHPMSRILEHMRDEHLDHYLANLDDLRQKRPHRGAAAQSKQQRKQPSSVPRSTARVVTNSSRSRRAG